MSGPGSGTLDREITIQRAAYIQSESGESQLDWDHATSEVVWAQWIPPLNTKEAYFAEDRQASHFNGVFRIYDITPRPTPDSTRILWDGWVFDVRPYIEGGRHEYLDIPVQARGE